jgi:hypothetical protein
MTPAVCSYRSLLAALAAASVGLAGCTTTPPAPATVSKTQKVVAGVEAIDLSKRLVTLRGPDGKALVVQVGSAVRNLEQVRVGDRVVVEYTEAIMAEVVKKGTGTTDVGMAAARAAPGDRPGAAMGDFVRFPVTVFDVDTVQNVVEVTGPRGFNRRIAVRDPKMRDFIRGLRKGDEVEVTYSEAFAVSVEPAR